VALHHLVVSLNVLHDAAIARVTQRPLRMVGELLPDYPRGRM